MLLASIIRIGEAMASIEDIARENHIEYFSCDRRPRIEDIEAVSWEEATPETRARWIYAAELVTPSRTQKERHES